MNEQNKFAESSAREIQRMGEDRALLELSNAWMVMAGEHRYSYHFSWLGRPIIQYPQDIVAMQELIWKVKPDLIIETGIAHGGSLVFSASMLAQLDMCDAIEAGAETINPRESKRKVLGVDIDIRSHNRKAVEAHPMASRIQMIQGSSIAPEIIKQVHEVAADYKTVLVCLDSNHTHDHVLAELEAYAALTSVNSYCVVFDTIVEDMPKEMYPDRPWGPGNNPKTAVHEYLRKIEDGSLRDSNNLDLHFALDKEIENKLLLTVAPAGFLKRLLR